mgnify:CR=1 FL=1
MISFELTESQSMVRDVVREQAALQIGLGRERELSAAVLHRRHETALLRHAPDEDEDAEELRRLRP